jgi:3-deoxy-D-manno-octulosonic-acid transferase
MLFVYNLLIFLSTPLIFVYLLVFLLRRKDFRASFWERLGKIRAIEDSSSPDWVERPRSALARESGVQCFWIHAVSVGEVMAAVPLVKGLRLRFPMSRIVFSTYTSTGRETVKNKCPEADQVFYFPLDVFPVVQRVVATVRPTVFLLVETDIWPIFLRTLAHKGIPSVVINGRISPRRLLATAFYRRVLDQVSFFCMQTDVDAERVLALGIDARKVTVTGNMKFAQAIVREGEPARLRKDFGLPVGTRLLIAGSTHVGEEDEIVRCYQHLCRSYKDFFLLLAPRHPERIEKVEGLCRSYGFSCVRRSRADGASGNAIFLLDTIGELSDAYALGTFIFVGGSLVRRGGHNVLEPAAWGKPIFFGPHMEHYSGIASMLEREGAAIQVKSGEELAIQIDRLIKDNGRLLEMGQKAASFVAKNQGAVERNLDVIEKILEQRTKTTNP